MSERQRSTKSPANGKGVQFESETQDEDQDRRKKTKSESTDPLLTDSLTSKDSDEEDQDVVTTHIRVP